jgi:hypothetical protein
MYVRRITANGDAAHILSNHAGRKIIKARYKRDSRRWRIR